MFSLLVIRDQLVQAQVKKSNSRRHQSSNQERRENLANLKCPAGSQLTYNQDKKCGQACYTPAIFHRNNGKRFRLFNDMGFYIIPEILRLNGFNDLHSHGKNRVQRGHGLLENHGDLPAAVLPHFSIHGFPVLFHRFFSRR